MSNDMDTKEYATFCYDTVEMENALKPCLKCIQIMDRVNVYYIYAFDFGTCY